MPAGPPELHFGGFFVFGLCSLAKNSGIRAWKLDSLLIREIEEDLIIHRGFKYVR